MDTTLSAKRIFKEWQYLAFDPTTWDIGYYNEYTSNIDIYVLDSEYIPVHGVRLWEAFPKTINATELNQGTNNEIIKLGVVFSFRYWTTLDIDRQKPNLGEKIFDTITTGVERQLSSNLPRVLTKLKF